MEVAANPELGKPMKLHLVRSLAQAQEVLAVLSFHLDRVPEQIRQDAIEAQKKISLVQDWLRMQGIIAFHRPDEEMVEKGE